MNKSFKFNIQYLILFMAFGTFYPFFSVYLDNVLHLDKGHTGSILAVGPFIAVFSLPIWGVISDLTKKAKWVFLFALIWSAFSSLLLGTPKTFLVMFSIYAFYEIARSTLISLNDSIAIRYCNEKKLDYSVIRSYGSLGYVLGSLILGQVINIFSTSLSIMFYFTSTLLFLTILITFSYPNVKVEHEAVNIRQDLKLLLRNRQYLLIILIGAMTISFANGLGAFVSIYIQEVGGSIQHVSYVAIFGAIPEVLFLRYSNRLALKFGITRILTWAVLAMMLRFMGYFFFPDVWSILTLTILHGIMISLTIPPILTYINKIVPTKLHSTAVTIYGSVLGLGSSIFTLMGGYVSELISIKNLFIFAFFLSFIAFILIYRLKSYEIK